MLAWSKDSTERGDACGATRRSPSPKQGLKDLSSGKSLEGFELGKPGIRSASVVTAKAKSKITTTKKIRNRLKLQLRHLPTDLCAHPTR